MKRDNFMFVLLLLIFINSFNFHEMSNTDNKDNQNLENTILLEIKTFKYTSNQNFNYYIGTNPHSYYKLSENDPKFFNIDLILNSIYTDISIGTPSEHILGFFAGKLNIFEIFYYNKTKSETFNILTNEKEKIVRCSDDFKFKCQNETYELKGMEFIKTQYSSLRLSHSFLGLQISSKDITKMKKYNISNDNQSIVNFVESLQKSHCKKLNISNYYWTIKYFNESNNTLSNNIDGIFYFGEPPHVFDPINYNKEDFIEINTEAGYDNLYWGLKFDNIDFLNKTSGEIIPIGKYIETEYSLIYPELNFFITSEKFFSRIKRIFFNKYINKRKSKDYNNSICYEKFISIVDDINLISLGNYNDLKGIYDIFYCNKTRVMEYGIEKFYNEFPIINFHHLLLGYNFEFNASDLFFEKEGNLYFLMTIKLDRGDKWIFGKTFMKKYQIVFNNDMRTIGFYLKNRENKKIIKPKEIINNIDDNNYKNILLIIIIGFVLLLIILGVIIIYCIKKEIWIFKNKKNANELESLNDSPEIF